jgi:hypothetical protein
LKRYKSQSSDQIPAGLSQVGGEILHLEIHELVNSVWNMEELPEQWKECIIVPVYKMGNKTDISNYCGISLLSISLKYPKTWLSKVHMQMKLLTGHQCGVST